MTKPFQRLRIDDSRPSSSHSGTSIKTALRKGSGLFELVIAIAVSGVMLALAAQSIRLLMHSESSVGLAAENRITANRLQRQLRRDLRRAGSLQLVNADDETQTVVVIGTDGAPVARYEWDGLGVDRRSTVDAVERSERFQLRPPAVWQIDPSSDSRRLVVEVHFGTRSVTSSRMHTTGRSMTWRIPAGRSNLAEIAAGDEGAEQ